MAQQPWIQKGREMETKSMIVETDMKGRRDKKIISVIQSAMKETVDILYRTGYLDPHHEVVEMDIRIKSDVPD